MGAVKRSFDRSNVMTTSTGSANAYVLTYAQPPEGYTTGEIYRFFANFTNTAAPTLNINGLGTRAILRADGTAMAANEIVSGQVVSVVVSGNNFLHQPVGTRFFTDDVSIQKASDSVLALEDTSAPATTFRQKKIYSSKNVGGGDDWLFRMVRPSDGATRDFTLSAAAPGTVWTTGNFNPATKADLAGANFNGNVFAPSITMGGSLNLIGAGTNSFQNGNGDAATYATHNVRMLLWNGLGISTYDGSINGVYDARAGRWDTKAAPRVNGADVWYPGNFNPSTKADLNTNVRFNGVSLGNSEGFIYGDQNINNVVVRTGTSSAGYKYSFWNSDGFYTSAGGGRFNSDLYTSGRVIVGENQPASYIEMRDTDEGTRYVHNNSGLIGFLGKGGDWIFRVGDDGAVWTKQFGDLNSRIENRASDFAVARANERVAKTGDIMSGDLEIRKNYAALILHYPGIKRGLWHVREDGRLHWMDQGGQSHLSIGGDGTVSTQQLGDLATYINNTANNARADRVFKGGDTMTGPLYIDYGYPQLQLTNRDGNGFAYIDFTNVPYGHTDFSWRMWHNTGNNEWSVSYVDNGARFSVRTDGSLWSAQMGDINTRIETRGQAFADDRLNTATARINNKSARLAYVGDLNCGNYGRDMAEPWGGGVITGLQSNNASGYATGGRGRQLQMSDSNGNWYACGYV